MNRVKRIFAALAACLVLGFSGQLMATEAKHLNDDMDGKEAAWFVSGMVSMLSYLQYRLGYPERGDCIDNWYYQNSETPAKVADYMYRYPDKHAEAIVYVLAKNACFKEK